MRAIYTIVAQESDKHNVKRVVAVCTSLEKATELLKDIHKNPSCECVTTNDWVEESYNGYPAVEQENSVGWEGVYRIDTALLDDWIDD